MNPEKGLSRRLAMRFFGLPRDAQLLLSALAAVVPFYFAAFLSASVAKAMHGGGPGSLTVHAAVFVVLLTAVVATARYLTSVYQDLIAEEQARVAMRLHAYAFLDRLVVNEVRRVAEASPAAGDFTQRFVASKADLQELVEAAYAAFEAGYGKSARTEDRIDFEVTFMTRSYRDHLITIPACANRDGRAPRSMILRQQHPDIYEGTVTAAIYRAPRPSLQIIEDTASPEGLYQELYPDQIKRIRSSIVYPVLSNSNDLLGTLVVHCDKTGFFHHGDEKYWTDLLEVFAKRLALVKLKLDALVGVGAPLPVCAPDHPF